LESDVNNAETTVAPSAVEEVADEVEAEEVVGSLPQKRSHNELLQKPMKYDVSFGIYALSITKSQAKIDIFSVKAGSRPGFYHTKILWFLGPRTVAKARF
jgi:hypothetical protein